MELHNINSILDYAKTISSELEDDRLQLIELEKTPFFKHKEQELLQNRIRVLVDQLHRIYYFLSTNTNFKTEEFTIFLVNFLNTIKSGYTATKVSSFKSHYLPTPPKGKTLFDCYSRESRIAKQHQFTYYIISNERIAEFIKTQISSTEELETFLKLYDTENIICIKQDTVYPFNSDFTMKEEFAKNPEVTSAILELIQLKLDNPDITDNERYQSVLQNFRVKKKTYH